MARFPLVRRLARKKEDAINTLSFRYRRTDRSIHMEDLES